MTDSDILGFVIDSTSRMNSYWNFFVGVSTAVFATLATGGDLTKSWAFKLGLTFAFVMFIASNLLPMLSVIEQKEALLDMRRSDTVITEALASSFSRVGRNGYIAFHLVADTIVLSAIWFVPWSRPSET
jgi:hypothetical protein